MKIIDSPICEHCGETEETVEHYLRECPAFGRIRQEIIGRQILQQEELSRLSVQDILNFTRETGRFDGTWQPP